MFGNWLISNFFSSSTVFTLLAPSVSFTSFTFTFTSFAIFKPFPTSSFKSHVNKSLKPKKIGLFPGLVG